MVAVVSAPPSAQLGLQVSMRWMPRARATSFPQRRQRSSVNLESLNRSLPGLILSFPDSGSSA